MSDAYGTIVVGFSENFKGDKEALVDALNMYRFTSDDSEFVYSGDGVYLDNRDAQYPSVFAKKEVVEVCIGDSDETLVMDAKDVTDEDEIYDERTEDVEFAELVAHLSKHIEMGSMYLTAASQQKRIGISTYYLNVHSNGDAERGCNNAWSGEERHVYNEELKAA